MGTIIRFPDERRIVCREAARTEPATVVILPVVRIERHLDEPYGGFDSNNGAGRRRPSRRS